MYAPYQCVHIVGGQYVIAASGPQLHSFNLADGSKISSWTCPVSAAQAEASKAVNAGSTQGKKKEESNSELEQQSDHPSKKRKLTSSTHGIETENAESEGTGAKQQELRSNATARPNVIYLTSSTDGTHVVAVTGEDKAVRVFEHEHGNLKQISQRPMSKRPSAIALAASDSTIICTDKFGDVFALPLLIPESPQEAASQTTPSSEAPKQFAPAASDLTVHSARNRKALENQMRQKAVKAEKPTEMHAGQQLLLGHVSMLTDVASVEKDGRPYIITADRDEHIRVSRGIPQSHIIEGYCLGHTDFVSKLCVPASAPGLLVSGGGDDDLFCWDWLSGELLQRENLISHIHDASSGSAEQKVVVSGLHYLSKAPGSSKGSIAVTCEGIPAILFFSISEAGRLSYYQTLSLDGNVVAGDTSSSGDSLIISVDSLHQPGSTSQLRDEAATAVEPLQTIHLEGDKWSKSAHRLAQSSCIDIAEGGVKRESWAGLLYGLSNLRKRGDGGEGGDE